MYALDIQTWKWKKVEPNGAEPQPRQGHKTCIIKTKLLVYGGWSSETQFADAFVFDTETNDWTDLDIAYQIPRWNHCSILVEAIPSWKFFVFGGS